MKIKFSNNYELKKKYDGTLTPMKFVDQEQYGMKKIDNWYGGNMTRLANVDDTSLMLVLNKQLKTIDVGYVIGRENEVPLEDCAIFGIEVEFADSMSLVESDNDEGLVISPEQLDIKKKPVARRKVRK
jgi:hypothetical protein